MDKRGGEYHDFPLKKFSSHSAEKFRRGTLLCFRKFLVSKNFMDKRGGGYHDFPSKLFCLTGLNHFVEELFCVSESFGYRKVLCLRGEYHDFLWKICCLTVPKNFVGEPFCFTKFLVSKNFMLTRVMSPFSVENFLSHSTKNILRGILWCFINFGYRKMLGITCKNNWHDRDLNPEPSASEPCPNPTAVIYF